MSSDLGGLSRRVFWRRPDSFWVRAAGSGLLTLMLWLAGVQLLAQHSRSVRQLESELDQMTGRERLATLVELIGLLRDEDPSLVLVHGTEALALLEAFVDPVSELLVLSALSAAAFARELHEEAVSYGERAELLARQEDDHKGLATALSNLSQASRRLGEHHRALELSQEAVALFTALDDDDGAGGAWNDTGYAHWRLGDYPGALAAYQNAHAAYERIQDPAGIGKSLRNMGNLYSDLGRIDASLEILARALALQRKEGNESEIGKLLTSLGKSYLVRGEPTVALEYLLDSLEIKEKLGDRTGIGVVLYLIGKAYRDQGNLVDARSYLEQALHLRREVGDRKRAAETTVAIAAIERLQGRTESAMELVQEGLSVALELDARNVVQAAHFEMASIHEDLGQYREANTSLRQHERVNKEVFNIESARLVTQAQARFESQQKERQIEGLQNQLQVSATAIERNRVVRAILMSGLAGLGLAIGLSLRARRRLVTENLRLREQLASRAPSERQVRREVPALEQAETESAVDIAAVARARSLPAGEPHAASLAARARDPWPVTDQHLTEQVSVPADGPKRLCLRSRTGKQRQVFALSSGGNRIGRMRDNEVVVPTTGISRLHAQLTLGPESIEVEDLGSVNGTRVNGQRIERSRVQLGDVLQLGRTELVLEEIDVRDTELGLTLEDPEKEELALRDAVEAENDTSTLYREQFAEIFSKLAISDDHLAGTSSPMRALYDAMQALVGAEMTVLIEGETGVGKEGIARILHQSSCRRGGPFIVVNCAAIPSELLEAEMFGIGDGVATGVKGRSGWFRTAHGGVLVLDEIGDMPLQLQAKLLRALQEKKIQPVGGAEFASDVWVIAVTNQNLQKLAEQGSFRKDLYYRLAGSVLHVPPLRERQGDIEPLIRNFLKRAGGVGKRVRGLTVKALGRLERYEWPGNVRELENEINRLKSRVAEGQMIDSTMLSAHILEHLPVISPPVTETAPVTVPPSDPVVSLSESAAKTPASALFEDKDAFHLKNHVHATERRIIAHALSRAGTSQRKAAILLGISRSTLARKIAELGISPTPSP